MSLQADLQSRVAMDRHGDPDVRAGSAVDVVATPDAYQAPALKL